MQKLSSGLAVRVARIQREATSGARLNAAGRRPGAASMSAQLSSARRRLARARRAV